MNFFNKFVLCSMLITMLGLSGCIVEPGHRWHDDDARDHHESARHDDHDNDRHHDHDCDDDRHDEHCSHRFH